MSALSGIRLLIIEDDPLDSALIERHLRRALVDFSTIVVADEELFREALESTHPDVILADYHLPKFDGISALRIARVLAPSTPFIFVSESIGEERAVETLLEGAADYILKDRLSRLGPAITRALEERQERSLRQKVEQALILSEQRFQYAAEATREIIWDWDIVADTIWFSTALHRFWGYMGSFDQVSFEWLTHRIHPEDLSRTRASLAAALGGGERWATEFRFARADGSYSNVYLSGVIMRQRDGAAIRVVGSMLDMTERLQMELQLEHARRVESQIRVAATITHEFNNILMSIQPMADAIGYVSRDEKVKLLATQLVKSISRGKRVTEQILRYSRPAEPALSLVDIGAWLEDFAPALRALAGANVAVTINGPPTPVAARIDSAQIQQVLSNLTVNARDAMLKGGTIAISVQREGEKLSLTVSDDGAGIPSEVVDRIFEPFFTTKRVGTGLGLAVAQQIVIRHGGSLKVSTMVGKGTTFSLLLPVESSGAPLDPPVH